MSSSALALRAGVEPERHPRGTVDAALLDTALAPASEDEETALDRLEDALGPLRLAAVMSDDYDHHAAVYRVRNRLAQREGPCRP